MPLEYQVEIAEHEDKGLRDLKRAVKETAPYLTFQDCIVSRDDNEVHASRILLGEHHLCWAIIPSLPYGKRDEPVYISLHSLSRAEEVHLAWKDVEKSFNRVKEGYLSESEDIAEKISEIMWS